MKSKLLKVIAVLIIMTTVMMIARSSSAFALEVETPEAIIEEETPTAVAEEVDSEAIIEEETPTAVAEEVDSEAIVEEETPAAVVEEVAPIAIAAEIATAHEITCQLVVVTAPPFVIGQTLELEIFSNDPVLLDGGRTVYFTSQFEGGAVEVITIGNAYFTEYTPVSEGTYTLRTEVRDVDTQEILCESSLVLEVTPPPVVTPPVETPPVVTPPVETPPVVTPPVETPPVVTVPPGFTAPPEIAVLPFKPEEKTPKFGRNSSRMSGTLPLTGTSSNLALLGFTLLLLGIGTKGIERIARRGSVQL